MTPHFAELPRLRLHLVVCALLQGISGHALVARGELADEQAPALFRQQASISSSNSAFNVLTQQPLDCRIA
jgi:hypothetical protein